MDIKEILVCCYTLCLREFKAHKVVMSGDLIKNTINSLKLDSMVDAVGTNKLQIVVSLIFELIEKQDVVFDITSMKQRLLSLLEEDQSLYEKLALGLEEVIDDQSYLLETITQLKNRILTYHRQEQYFKHVFEQSRQANEVRSGKMTLASALSHSLATLEAIAIPPGLKDNAIIQEFDAMDIGEVSKVLNDAMDMGDESFVIPTPWIAMNNRLGGLGVPRGSLVGVAGKEFNNKSGVLKQMFLTACTAQKPKLVVPNKKPLILFISAEETLPEIFASLYPMMFRKPFIKEEIKAAGAEHIANTMMGVLKATGNHIKFMYVGGEDWDYKGLFNAILYYEAMNYEIAAIFVDCLYNISTVGCTKSVVAGEGEIAFLSRLKSFCKPKKISIYSPFQLNPDVARMMRISKDYVKELPNKNFYAKASKTGQELDIEIFTAVRNNEYGFSWQEFQIGKHKSARKYVANKYFCLKFEAQDLPLKSDLDTGDSSYSSIGGTVEGTSVDHEFF